MRKVLVAVAIVVACSLAWCRGEASAQERDLNKVLADAIAKAKTCEVPTEGSIMTLYGDPGGKELALSRVFKPGRYVLSKGVLEGVPDGVPLIAIQFNPKPVEEWKPDPEGKEVLINYLMGLVIINGDTGELFHIAARLSQHLLRYKDKEKTVKSAELDNFEFDWSREMEGQSVKGAFEYRATVWAIEEGKRTDFYPTVAKGRANCGATQ